MADYTVPKTAVQISNGIVNAIDWLGVKGTGANSTFPIFGSTGLLESSVWTQSYTADNSSIQPNGKATVGSTFKLARVDHVHPRNNPFQLKTTSFTVNDDYDAYLIDTTSGAVVVTFPSATGINGRVLTFKGTSTLDTNNCTLTPAAGTIDGEATYVMNSEYESITVMTDGNNWYII